MAPWADTKDIRLGLDGDIQRPSQPDLATNTFCRLDQAERWPQRDRQDDDSTASKRRESDIVTDLTPGARAHS